MPINYTWPILVPSPPEIVTNFNVIASEAFPSPPGTLTLFLLQQTGPSTLQLYYSVPPLMYSISGVSDSLDLNNYTIVGPSSESISSIQPVPGAPTAVNINLNGPLALGTWKVTVKNVTTASGIPLSTPFSLTTTALTQQQLITAANGAI